MRLDSTTQVSNTVAEEVGVGGTGIHCVDGRWLRGWEVVSFVCSSFIMEERLHYFKEGGKEEESGREEGREGERGSTLYQCSLIPQGLWWLSR